MDEETLITEGEETLLSDGYEGGALLLVLLLPFQGEHYYALLLVLLGITARYCGRYYPNPGGY